MADQKPDGKQRALESLRDRCAEIAALCTSWYEGHGDAVGERAADEIRKLPLEGDDAQPKP